MSSKVRVHEEVDAFDDISSYDSDNDSSSQSSQSSQSSSSPVAPSNHTGLAKILSSIVAKDGQVLSGAKLDKDVVKSNRSAMTRAAKIRRKKKLIHSEVPYIYIIIHSFFFFFFFYQIDCSHVRTSIINRLLLRKKKIL
jgi:hypothetical protein